MGESGHLLHVISSVTLTELRDAQVLSGFIKLQIRTNTNTWFNSKTQTWTGNCEGSWFWSDHLVAVVGSLDGNLLNLLTDTQLALGEIWAMAEIKKWNTLQSKFHFIWTETISRSTEDSSTATQIISSSESFFYAKRTEIYSWIRDCWWK